MAAIRALKRVLVCRTDNIGDVVLTLPLAGYLKQHVPGVQVDFLVRDYAAPAVRKCSFVDNVLTVEAHGDFSQLFADGAYDTVIFAFPNRRLAQAATIKKYGVKTWREVQAKRAYATSFDSSVEVIKTDKAPTRNSAEALVNVLTGKVA